MKIEGIRKGFFEAIKLDNQKSFSTGKISNDEDWSFMFYHFENLLDVAEAAKESTCCTPFPKNLSQQLKNWNRTNEARRD